MAKDKTSRREAESARRQRAAEIQRAHQRRERRRIVTGAIVVALVVVGIGVGVFSNLHHAAASTTTHQIVPAAVSGTTTAQPTPQRVKNPTDIKGVLAWNTAGYPGPGTPGSGTLSHDHVAGPGAVRRDAAGRRPPQRDLDERRRLHQAGAQRAGGAQPRARRRLDHLPAEPAGVAGGAARLLLQPPVA